MDGLADLKKLSIADELINSRNSDNLGEIWGSGYNYTRNEEKHNQSTLALHEACQSGDVSEVRDILSEGRADLNALIAGHRALRTALHKASAYGHTDVVKLLLKAGAEPDKASSVQRTALHEACMGGHVETLEQLVQYTKDIDQPDSHGQTAAHSAAYHGETKCLKVLIDNSCDINFQDSEMCTPAHLVVKKNHFETLQCFLDTGKMDILRADKQGKTSVHYAAIYGSISCLKVFRKSKVDLKVTDHNGAISSHHAAAGGHLECLQFLTKVGITHDKKDRFGKTSAHYAAQRGSSECLHWLLEQGADSSSIDDMGNTPAHCAASGHMAAMNCLINHGTDTTVPNHQGDTPDMLSRKHGHTQAYQKAVTSEIKCPFCVKQKAQEEYDLKHQPSAVEKSIKLEERVIFKTPVKTGSSSHATSRQKGQSKPTKRQTSIKAINSKRELSSQYYGDHLFTLNGK